MNFGINPHWRSFLNERMVGEWTDFALDQGFKALKFPIDSRMLAKGLDQIFNKNIVLLLQQARFGGLRLHLSLALNPSHLSDERDLFRLASVSALIEALKFLEDSFPPDLVVLPPGQLGGFSPDGPRCLIESFGELRDKHPFLRLALEAGKEGECLASPEAIGQLIGAIKDVAVVIDLGGVWGSYGDDLPRVKQILRAVGDNLYEISWSNILFHPLRRHLPLSGGYFRGKHYLEILSALPSEREIWHVLDYRDRSKKAYREDKLLLEDLIFQARNFSR